MPSVSGSLRYVTLRASAVSEVLVRAPVVRTEAGGVVTSSADRVPVVDGVVEFTVSPGPAVLTLVEAGRPVDTIPILVGDAGTQSLADVVTAARVADDATQREIEKLAAQVVADAHAAAAAAAAAKDSRDAAASSASAAEGSASAADVSAKAAKASQNAAAGSASSAKQSESNAAASKNAAASSASDAATSAGNAKKSEDAAKAAQARSEKIATSTSWDGDKLTVNGKTSPSLTGPPGPKGETGSVENVSWADISGKPDFASTWEQVKGKPDAFPTTWDEVKDKPESFPPGKHEHEIREVNGLTELLLDKSPRSHRHTLSQISDAPNTHTPSAVPDTLMSRDAYGRAHISTPVHDGQIANKRYVDAAVSSGSKIKVVSSLPSYPDSSTVYIVV
ncbi:TPA: hypothetical protein I8W37_002583 [Corynebacterium striatum]|nr:hypothetical protein [Corynebacterium striatum]HAT1174682.1 hypothetical protein [Corynebacterium striatum]HAT1200008.1 hypothetical protein [Corynebacterium striatum]HAT1207128.1 hypothetical protein [Corynebacterium striatum]HAT1282697.1 hypothetical protein [Corynebacterium striatum]